MKKIDEMKRYWAVVWVSAALFASSCSAGGEGASAGEGSVEFDCSVSAFVGTRAETRELPARTHSRCRGAVALPVGDRRRRGFCTKPWPIMTSRCWRRAIITASFTYGDPEAEGAGAACFSGEEAFTIVARKTVTEPVSVSLANSVFTLVFSDWFRKYYSEFTVNIRTDSGFRPGSSVPIQSSAADRTAVRQGGYRALHERQRHEDHGVEVAFPETLVGTTAAVHGIR